MTEAYNQVFDFVRTDQGVFDWGALLRIVNIPTTDPEYVDAVDAVSAALREKVLDETNRKLETEWSLEMYKRWAKELVDKNNSVRAVLASGYTVRDYMPAWIENKNIDWSASGLDVEEEEPARYMSVSNTGYSPALDRFHAAAVGLLAKSDRMDISQLAYRVDRFIASDIKKFPTSQPGQLFLSHGLRLPITLGGPLGITPNGLVLDKEYQVAVSSDKETATSSAGLLDGSRVYAFGPEDERVYALRMKTKPWLRVLYPYGEQTADTINLPLHSLRQEIASQWSGFGCSVNGQELALSGLDAFFDRTMSRAYYVVDLSTHTRASSKEKTQEFLDSTSHTVLFVPSAIDDPAALHRRVSEALGSEEDLLSGPWSPLVYSQVPFKMTDGGRARVDLYVKGRRGARDASELPIELFKDVRLMKE